MLAYYGYTISPNQIETGEGFLICRNVPIARSGMMEYQGRELGLDTDRIIAVHRSAEEVFSPAAMASFEGKPVTDDHPPELLTPETAALYEKGHAQNIRQGAGEWEGYVIADLHVHDGRLIEAIQSGKREVSCGYECEYHENGDGTYSQRNIRGNHVAVVNRGRAGKRAAILDSDTAKKTEAKGPERKKMGKNSLLLKLFGQAVKDKSPEEIERMAVDAADALDTDKAGSGAVSEESNRAEEAPAEKAKTEAVRDAAFFDALEKKVDKLLALLDQESEKNKEPEEDPMDAAIKKLEGKEEEKQENEAKVVPAKETDKEECSMDQALAAAILKKVRPSVAAIQDAAQRKAVSDALIACVTGNGDSDISRILQAAQKNARRTNDSRPDMDLDSIQKAYDSLNPHRKESR